MAMRSLLRSLRRAVRSPRAHASAFVARARGDAILAHWSAGRETGRNWGDAINEPLIRALSGRVPVNLARISQPVLGQDVHAVVGSILDDIDHPSLVVWGAGFKYEGGKPRRKPRMVRAVRGRLSRENLLRAGIPCPEVYGDPVLLLPRIHPVRPDPRIALGIVPHYVDAGDPRLSGVALDSSCAILDVRSEAWSFVDQVTQCRCIASSSLHGLILAHAYGIPAVWIEFSSKVVGSGFKFRDYYSATDAPETQPVRIGSRLVEQELIAKATLPGLPDSDALLEACPFLSPREGGIAPR